MVRPWTKDNMDALLKAATKRALTAVGQTLETSAARLAPVGQYPKGSGRVGGRLKGSITWAVYDEVSPTRSGQVKSGDAVSRPTDHMTAHVGTNVEYAPYVEYGTRFMGAQSYLRRALDENKQACMRLYAEQLSKGLQSGK